MSAESDIVWLKGQVLSQGELLSALIGGLVDADQFKAALRTRTERGIAQLLGAPVPDDVGSAYSQAMADIIRMMSPSSPSNLQARVDALEKRTQNVAQLAVEAGGATAAIASFVWSALPAASRNRLLGELQAAQSEAEANNRPAAVTIFKAAIAFIENAARIERGE